MSIAEKLIAIAENEQKVFDAGYQKGKTESSSGNDEFWDVFQDYGNRTIYRYAFYGHNWKDDIYNPKYPIVIDTSGQDCFYTTDITDTKVDITVLTSTTSRLFSSEAIKTIRKVIVSEDIAYTNWFNNAVSLENIIIEGVIGNSIDLHWSPLTKESIISVINALSATTSDLTVTFKKTAINNAFRTSEGLTDGSTSEEWTSLTGTKTNWTISLI